MTGLLDEYAGKGVLDLDDVPDGPNYEIADDWYDFEIGDVFLKEGTDNKPDDSWIIVEYLLGDEGKKKSEWFALPKDPDNPTDAEKTKLSFWKQRLDSLGVAPEDRNKVGRGELVGLTGTLQLKSTKSKKDGKMYQNIYNVRVAEVETTEEPEEAPRASRRAAPAKAGAVQNPFKK